MVITGESLAGASAVTFGTTPAISFHVDSNTQVTAVSPALPGGLHDVVVTTPAGATGATEASRFASLTTLSISQVSPREGFPEGGTSVTISGSGFTTVAAVNFGAVDSSSFTINSDTQITAIAPAQPNRTVVAITVTRPGGSATSGPNDQFTYLARPVLTKVTPQWGPSAGGTPVVLTGTHFTGATAVIFGDTTVACPDRCTVVDDNEIHVVTPTHPIAGVPVAVTTAAGGPSALGLMFAFTGEGAFLPTGSCTPECGRLGTVLLPSGKVLGVGGSFTGLQANLYDPLTGTWTKRAQCELCPIVGTDATMIPNGPPSVCGANCGKVLLVAQEGEAMLYDPQTDQWSFTGDSPVSGGAQPGVALADGSLLFVDGQNGARFHPGTGTWTSTGALTACHRNHTSTLLQDGTVLVAGGGGPHCPSRPPRTDAAEIYNPATNAWSDVGPMGQARLAHTATRLPGGKVLVAGGSTVSVGVNTRVAELYDPATKSWQPARDATFARDNHDAALLPDGRVLLTGGDGPAAGGSNAAFGNNPSISEIYDPASGTWTPTGPSLSLQDRGGFNAQIDLVRSVVLPPGPASVCGAKCGQVLVVRARDDGALTIPLTPSAVLYAVAPRASIASPSSGPTDGGTAVVITGTALASVSTVSFGGVPAASVTPDPVSPDTRLVAVSPLHTPGAVDVAIVTAGGATIAAGNFTFQTPVVTTTTTTTTTPTPTTMTPVTGSGTTPSALSPAAPGYSLVAADGGVFSFGTAFYGSTGAIRLNQPIVAIEHSPTGKGYWLVASDGGVFAFGDARFFGSTGSLRLTRPIVGMRSTLSGNGYWLVASDGGVFAFGDAVFLGSTAAIRLAGPIVGLERSASGSGYWLVGADGGIFAFGDARYFGSTGGIRLAQPVVAMARGTAGAGYQLVGADGGIFAFGDARFFGSTGALRLNSPVVGMAATDGGYVLCARDGGVFAFGSAHFRGSMGAARLNQPVVACSTPLAPAST